MMIRLAETKDIPAVAGIYERILDAQDAGLCPVGWERGVYPTAASASAALSRGELFVLEDQGTILGSAVINQTQMDSYKDGKWKYAARSSEVMVLHTLVIDPLHNHGGYGRKLVEYYEQYALDHGCTYLRMDTQEKNLPARALYEKLGYRTADIVPCVFNGIPDVQLVLLEKKL